MSHSSDQVTFECVVCAIPFDSIELLSAHVQLVHDSDGGGADDASSGLSDSASSPRRNGHASSVLSKNDNAPKAPAIPVSTWAELT